MAHQQCSDPVPLIVIDDEERQFSLSRLDRDIPRAADDHGRAFLFNGRNQRHMVLEIYVDEAIDLRIGKIAPDGEEAAIEGLLAGTLNNRGQRAAVVRL
jgi:hypothetical protein